MFLADDKKWVRMADLDGRRRRRRWYQATISAARESFPPYKVPVDGVLTRARPWGSRLMDELCMEDLQDVWLRVSDGRCCEWLVYGKGPLAR